MDFELNDENFFLFAARAYYNPLGVDAEEFNEDIRRFKYVKRLLNRYEKTGNVSERLILNHLIVIFNVFGIEPSLKMLELKLDEKHWPMVKPFLIFLRHIKNDQYVAVPMDKHIVEQLRKI